MHVGHCHHFAAYVDFTAHPKTRGGRPNLHHVFLGKRMICTLLLQVRIERRSLFAPPSFFLQNLAVPPKLRDFRIRRSFASSVLPSLGKRPDARVPDLGLASGKPQITKPTNTRFGLGFHRGFSLFVVVLFIPFPSFCYFFSFFVHGCGNWQTDSGDRRKAMGPTRKKKKKRKNEPSRGRAENGGGIAHARCHARSKNIPSFLSHPSVRDIQGNEYDLTDFL